MGFFNKKEDVLDFQLTEYGKHLLGEGKLKPAYYAFFDDDILYDVSGSGMTEMQNEAQPRIQRDTPRMKVIPTRKGAETRVREFLNNLKTAIGNNNSDPAENVEAFRQQQPFADKGRLAANPLGRSKLASRYAPAWQVKVLSQPEVSSSSTSYLSDGDHIENIPQINIDVDYETFYEMGPYTSKAISTYIHETDVFISLNKNYLMLEITEENTDFEKQNFDVEVFLSQSSPGGGHIAKAYMPESADVFIAPSVDNVEYFIDVLVDNEIPPEVIEELNISEKALYTSAERMNLNRNLYSNAAAAGAQPSSDGSAGPAGEFIGGGDDGQNEGSCD